MRYDLEVIVAGKGNAWGVVTKDAGGVVRAFCGATQMQPSNDAEAALLGAAHVFRTVKPEGQSLLIVKGVHVIDLVDMLDRKTPVTLDFDAAVQDGDLRLGNPMKDAQLVLPGRLADIASMLPENVDGSVDPLEVPEAALTIIQQTDDYRNAAIEYGLVGLVPASGPKP